MRPIPAIAAVAISIWGLAGTAEARCGYDTDEIVLFAAGSIDCLPAADGCGPYDDILDSVAETWREAGGGSLRLIGHSDTFASHEASLAISERRAALVREQLALRGIPFDLMTTEARGETDLARPTGDGVIDDLNNRVVIDIRQVARLARQQRAAAYRREAEAAIAAGIEPPPRPICF